MCQPVPAASEKYYTNKTEVMCVSGFKQLPVVSIFRHFCLVGCISLGLFGERRLIHIAAPSSNDQRLSESSADAFGSEDAFFFFTP